MKRRPFVAFVAVLVALGVLAATTSACAPRRRAADPGVLTIVEREQTAAFSRNFNPLVEMGTVRWPARHAMYEPMAIWNPMKGAYEPWLATAWKWDDDGLALRFTLRGGVVWSDGQPFTADDVAFTFDLLKRHGALDTRGVWGFLASVEAEGDATVVVRLSRRYSPLLPLVAQQAIVPAHVWRHVGDPVAFSNPDPVATGPFVQIGRFTPQAYEVVANPRYWRGKPAVRALRFLAFPSNESSNLALVFGELDWAGDFVPAVERTFVAKNPDHHRYWFPLIDGTVMLYAATPRAPYGDARVRRALSAAIDRPLVVKVAMHGTSRPADATGLNDAYARWHDADAAAAGADWVTFDRARAEAWLDEAGLVRPGGGGWRRLPDGKPWRVAIIVPAGWSDWVRAAQVIARGLRAAGVDAHVRGLDFNTWYEKVQAGDFDLSLGWTDVGPTPYGFYRGLMGSATVRPLGEPAAENWHRFGLPAADEALAALEATTDPFEEHRHTATLQRLFASHAPAIPLFPGPLWGEFSTQRFTGFPDAQNPFAPLSPHGEPQALLVLTALQPRTPTP